MNKRTLIQGIIARLTEELAVYVKAAEASRAEATHESSKAENKYDTRGLEASYLARGQSRQMIELETALEAFQLLPVRTFAPAEAIDVGAFVELEQKGQCDAYFIGPKAGGTEFEFAGQKVLIITLQSPLGAQLIGRKQGDLLKLNLPGSRTQYRVARVI